MYSGPPYRLLESRTGGMHSLSIKSVCKRPLSQLVAPPARPDPEDCGKRSERERKDRYNDLLRAEPIAQQWRQQQKQPDQGGNRMKENQPSLVRNGYERREEKFPKCGLRLNRHRVGNLDTHLDQKAPAFPPARIIGKGSPGKTSKFIKGTLPRPVLL